MNRPRSLAHVIIALALSCGEGAPAPTPGTPVNPAGPGPIAGSGGAGGAGGGGVGGTVLVPDASPPRDAPAAMVPDGGTGGSRDAAAPAPDAAANDGAPPPAGGNIQTVFLVLLENHDWAAVKNLPYIRHLTTIGAHSEQYFNPRRVHPSEPNYLWLEGGSSFGRTNDNPPAQNFVRNARHLSKLLDAAGVSWMSYQEDMAPGTCPIADRGAFATRHNPFVFFDDVSGAPPSLTNPTCVAHHRPFTQFLADLKAGKVARYNFITPNVDNDMHNGTPAQGDAWLKANIDPIINPADPNHNAALFAHAALIVTFDEGNDSSGSDGPIGMIVVSPFARAGFQDTSTPMPYFYTHSSTLLTLQKIFGVAAMPLGDAANARDLGALFTVFP
jgi:hypothetical protein